MLKVLIVFAVVLVGLATLFIIGAVTVRADQEVVYFSDMNRGDLKVAGFELPEKAEIRVVGVGARGRYNKDMICYGWIIDARTRRPVWDMREDCDHYEDDGEYLTKCEDVFRLPAGKYEAYYYVADKNDIYFGSDFNLDDVGEIISKLGKIITLKDEDKYYLEDDDLEELEMAVLAGADATKYYPDFSKIKGAIADFRQLGPDESINKGFTLTDKTRLRIQAIGEYSSSQDFFVDGGWIINYDSREVVWEMDKWNTDRAGGASKNRIFDDYVTLPAGNYEIQYVTDDSHDATMWNAQPPYDPFNYGIVVTPYEKSDADNVRDLNMDNHVAVIASLIKVRDDNVYRQGFILKKDARVRIYALGERNNFGDGLADYGWIVNADNLQRVWTMRARDTRYAGGASKNCFFDGVIDLKAGSYVLYYRTDDSHAYNEWNAPAPRDYKNYGITLFGVGDGFNDSDFELVKEFKDLGGDLIVNLTGLGNDEDVWKSFTLTKTSRLKIVALGEGVSREMYDYGWIENDDTRDVVWEMDYDMTSNAGGAEKNRIAADVIQLPEGNYTAYFVTDDSHSYKKFNASPPDDPDLWGISIRLVN